MRRTKLLTAVLFLLLLISYSACKKTDGPASTSASDRFFIVPSNAPDVIKRISESVRKQDSRHHFVNRLVKQIGYPRWDKAIIGSTVGKTNKNDAPSSFQFIYIPFAREADNYVNSSLIVKYNASDTLYRLLYAQQYKNFGFDSSSSHWTAEDVFNLFIDFDNSVFGHTSFIVTDGRLGGKDSSQRLQASLNHSSDKRAAKTSEWITGEICRSYTLCIIVGQTQRNQNQKG